MWTTENRGRYDRKGARYPSDMTDEEWGLIEPLLPPPRKPRRVRTPVDRREVLNAMLYVLATGCQWAQLPKGFPPKSTVHDYYLAWHGDGVLARVHHALYSELRDLEGRAASATMAIVDSQSVKGAEKGGPASMPPAMMRARKPRARSAISRSIRSAC